MNLGKIIETDVHPILIEFHEIKAIASNMRRL